MTTWCCRLIQRDGAARRRAAGGTSRLRLPSAASPPHNAQVLRHPAATPRHLWHTVRQRYLSGNAAAACGPRTSRPCSRRAGLRTLQVGTHGAALLRLRAPSSTCCWGPRQSSGTSRGGMRQVQSRESLLRWRAASSQRLAVVPPLCVSMPANRAPSLCPLPAIRSAHTLHRPWVWVRSSQPSPGSPCPRPCSGWPWLVLRSAAGRAFYLRHRDAIFMCFFFFHHVLGAQLAR